MDGIIEQSRIARRGGVIFDFESRLKMEASLEEEVSYFASKLQKFFHF